MLADIFMRFRINIAILVLLLLICSGLVIQIRSIPSSAPTVSFSFLGYSNAPAGQQFAVVTMTNKDRYPIRFVSIGAYVWFDSTNTPIGASVVPSLEGTEVVAGGSRTFRVEMHASDVKRAVELWVRRSTTTENLKEWSHGVFRRVPAPKVYGIRSAFIIQ